MAWPSKAEHKDHKVTGKQFRKALGSLATGGAVVASRGMLLPMLGLSSSAGYPDDSEGSYPQLTPMSEAEARKLAAKKKTKKKKK
tara:strand:- start:5610 stop:5864 length:255 start_codon:yes stop_codon:yes gene_type:complete